MHIIILCKNQIWKKTVGAEARWELILQMVHIILKNIDILMVKSEEMNL